MTLVSGESSSEDLQLQGQSALTVPKPSVYRDSCTGRYSVFATWQFTNIDGIDDGHPLGCVGTCNVSGEDGFGIALNRSVNSVSGYSLTTCGKTTTFACSTSRMHVEEGGAAGVGYAGLDKMYSLVTLGWTRCTMVGPVAEPTTTSGGVRSSTALTVQDVEASRSSPSTDTPGTVPA